MLAAEAAASGSELDGGITAGSTITGFFGPLTLAALKVDAPAAAASGATGVGDAATELDSVFFPLSRLDIQELLRKP